MDIQTAATGTSAGHGRCVGEDGLLANQLAPYNLGRANYAAAESLVRPTSKMTDPLPRWR